MIKKILIFVFLLVSSFTSLVSTVKADDEVRNLQVDLKAKGFSQSSWTDNLDSSNIIFAPNDKFQVQINVKNLGNRNQTQIEVGQLLPPTLVVTDANGANYSGNKLTYTIPQVSPNDTHTKTITVQVKDKSKIKKDLFKSSTTISIRSEIGTLASDSLYFFTSNGSIIPNSTSSTQTLPKTGSNPLITTFIGTSLTPSLSPSAS